FNEFKERIVVTDIVNVIEKGKVLGYFRPEINAKLLANMRIDQITAVMNPANFSNQDFNLVTLHMELMDHFLHGIFTEKGRNAYMIDYITNLKKLDFFQNFNKIIMNKYVIRYFYPY